ncbi:hypothetical protein PV325_011280, partial [Microctonus aethiopoides]
TPSFAITRFPGFGAPIFEGIPVSLKCEVDSNPFSAPIWQRGTILTPQYKRQRRYIEVFTCMKMLMGG